MTAGSQLEEYLRAVSRRLRVGRAVKRRALREIEDHVRQAAAREGEQGAGEDEAVRTAIDSFGSARAVADEFSAVHAGRPSRRRYTIALVTACAVTLAGLTVAGARLDKPVFGILFDAQRSVRQPGGGIVYQPPAATLLRLNPRTLRPLTRSRVQLLAGTGIPALSPDGSRLVAAPHNSARLRFVDLDRMRRLGDVKLASDPMTRIRAVAWVRSDRVLVVVQRMSKPYARRVLTRTLITVDANRRRVLARRALAPTAFGLSAVTGERFVFTQADSSHRSPVVRLVVAEATGAIRFRELSVGKVTQSGMRRGHALAVDSSGERAFVAVSFGRIVEIDLDRLALREHRPRLTGTVPELRPPVWSLSPSIVALDEHRLVASQLFARQVQGRAVPIAGVWLIDTRDWTARAVDASATLFLVADKTLLTYGYGGISASRPRAVRGAGITAYTFDGRRRYSLYEGKLIQRLTVVDGYLHTFGAPILLGEGDRLPAQRARAVFDLETGRNLGRVSKPPLRLVLVDEARP